MNALLNTQYPVAVLGAANKIREINTVASEHAQRFAVKALLVASMLSLTISTAQAIEFKGVLGFGLDLGGDTLVSGSYTDGSTYTVKANRGVVLNGGVVMVTGAFETQTTVGYKFGGPQAKNGSITWDVVPIELMEFYRTNNLRMGLGLVYQKSPKLVIDVSGSLSNGTYNFDNALGTVVQIGWAPKKYPFSIDLRYTAIKYKQSNVANPKDISGNSPGLYMSFFF